MRYDFSRRIDSMAYMPKCRKPNSSPASTIESNKWTCWSIGWWNSQPSSPTKLTRKASKETPATVIRCEVSHGNPSLVRSASVIFDSRSRERGPQTTNVPCSRVIFFRPTLPSRGSVRSKTSWSWRSAEPELTAKNLSPSRVIVNSDSTPPEAVSACPNTVPPCLIGRRLAIILFK